MIETKPWYQSIGIWAALVALLTAGLRLFRVELDPQLQRDLADWLLSAATVAGAGAALWGPLARQPADCACRWAI